MYLVALMQCHVLLVMRRGPFEKSRSSLMLLIWLALPVLDNEQNFKACLSAMMRAYGSDKSTKLTGLAGPACLPFL